MTLHRITYDPIERIELDASIALPDDINATRAKLNQLGTDMQTQFNGLSVDFNELNEQATNPVDGFAKQIQDLDNVTVQMAGNITSLDGRVKTVEDQLSGLTPGGGGGNSFVSSAVLFPAQITGEMLGISGDTSVYFSGGDPNAKNLIIEDIPIGTAEGDTKERYLNFTDRNIFPAYVTVKEPPASAKQVNLVNLTNLFGQPDMSFATAPAYFMFYSEFDGTQDIDKMGQLSIVKISATDWVIRTTTDFIKKIENGAISGVRMIGTRSQWKELTDANN